MQKLLFFFLVIVLISLSSCRKVYDFIRDHPDAHDSLCRITTISCNGFYNDPEQLDVTYNANGDPTDLVIRNGSTNSGNVDQHFRYDKYGRLIYYFVNYAPSAPNQQGGLIFHKYDYPRKNFVTDTTINYTPGYPPMYDSAFSASIKGYTLDDKGRIIKIYTVFRDPHQAPLLAGEITYDANGNLPIPDPDLSYDDKVNVYRTNKVWQFVYNDYSRNNLVKIDYYYFNAYNSFGLPTDLRNLINYYVAPFGLNNTSPGMKFEYACDAPKGPYKY